MVHVGSALSINSFSTVTLNGGTLRFNTVSGLNRLTYSSGTIQLAGDRNIGTDATITTLFGAFPAIPTGKGLTVEGTATLSKPLTIDGGAFKSTSLAVGAGGSLNFDHGILELTGGSVTGLSNLVVPANGEFREQRSDDANHGSGRLNHHGDWCPDPGRRRAAQWLLQQWRHRCRRQHRHARRRQRRGARLGCAGRARRRWQPRHA